MRTFLRDVAIFCGMNMLALGYLYAIYDVPNDYLAAINDKLDRLEVAATPRLLFVGGSSVAWGTHSSVVARELDLLPENIGYHAAVGLGVRIEEAKQLPRPGDVVVVSIEWSVFSDTPWPRKLSEVAIACPRAIRFMSTRDRKLVTDGLLPAVRMPLAAMIDDAKRNGLDALTHASAQRRKQNRLRASFNQYGDYEGHYDALRVGIDGKVVRLPKRVEVQSGIERLNRLNDESIARGVRLFYFVPIIPTSRFEDDRATITSLVELLTEGLDFPVLNAKEFVFEDDAFHDSCYHLRKKTGLVRTEILVAKLREYLK